jgi:hypothetical protein
MRYPGFMDRRQVLAAARIGLTVAAALVLLALVVGVRPRVQAQEQGTAPMSASTCYVCSGATSATDVAPAMHSVAAALPPPLPELPSLLMPLGTVVRVAPPPPLAPPRSPPPRA